jgi:hypothetical protein
MSIFAPPPVMVCELCGRGFIKHPGTKYDPVPVYFGSFFQSDGPCAGKILMLDRQSLIRRWDHAENRP